MPVATHLAVWRFHAHNAMAIALAFFVLAAILAPAVHAQEVPELQITSTNYILVDADTGEIYAQRGARERRAPASLTKVFTAIQTIEESPPEATITTNASDMVSEYASQVGFAPGETFTVEELLYGMMLPSGNDAAHALARGLGAEPGDTDEQAVNRFLDRINQRVLNMGLTDTHLVNADGWGVPGHYTTAYDMAAFTMYALRYPRFVRTFSTGTYETADGDYVFRNNNRMLASFAGIIGGKTGYDNDAGWCLVNVAERDGNRFIAVTLNGVAPDDWYDDNRVLLEYGFEQKALRAQSGTGITGEIVRYRDPDAATILAIASAGITVSNPLAAPVVQPASQPEPAPATTVEIAEQAPVPDLVPLSPAPLGGGSGGLLAAVAVAAALILLRGYSAWQWQPRFARGRAFDQGVSYGPELRHEPLGVNGD